MSKGKKKTDGQGGARAGAGRPQGSSAPRITGKEGWARIGTLIAPDAKERLDVLCTERGESIGEVVTWLVRTERDQNERPAQR